MESKTGMPQQFIVDSRSAPMPTECSPDFFGFEPVEGRAVVAAFDAGAVTSDAGALLLGAVAERDLTPELRVGTHEKIVPQLRLGLKQALEGNLGNRLPGGLDAIFSPDLNT
jgi:hypothetical protein